VLIGDEDFALHENLLKLYGRTYLNKKKRTFNYRLTRARRYVECAFGILANKWRLFHRSLDVNIKTAIWIIKAVTVLYNFVREKNGFNLENILHIEVNTHDFHNIIYQMMRGSISANSTRTTFINYFVFEAGSVLLQDEVIGH